MTEPARKRARSGSRGLRALGVIASVGAIAAAVAYTVYLPRAWTEEGPSMSPWLEEGDRFVSVHAAPTLGDVVVLESPVDGVTTVKRVVGVAGDRIAFVDGVLMRNGHAATDGARVLGSQVCRRERLGPHAYGVLLQRDDFPQTTDPIRIPAHHLYVLGDNRDRSHDSRFYGPVETRRVLGRVAWIWSKVTPRVPCR